jgi:hypothetical protein
MVKHVNLVTFIVGALAGGLVAWGGLGPLDGAGFGAVLGLAGGALQVRLLTRRVHDYRS